MARNEESDFAVYKRPPSPLPSIDEQIDDRENDLSVARVAKATGIGPASDIEQARLDAGTRARSVRDSFRHMMTQYESGDIEAADATFSEVKDRTCELWQFTSLRSAAFRSLLAMIDAATRFHTVGEFGDEQIRCLAAAYSDLPKSFLEQSDVSAHIRSFAKAGIDITSPLRERPKMSIQIIFEKTE